MTTLNIRLTVDEKENIKKKADKDGLSITDYVKSMTLQRNESCNEKNNINDEKNKVLEVHNNYLKQQIEVLNRDKEKLLQLLDQQQRLTLDSQNRIKQLEEPKKEEGFFKRLFKS